jgi:hypothetical protein
MKPVVYDNVDEPGRCLLSEISQTMIDKYLTTSLIPKKLISQSKKNSDY